MEGDMDNFAVATCNRLPFLTTMVTRNLLHSTR